MAALDENDGEIDKAVFDEYKKKFIEAVGSDLNTSNGVTDIYNVFKAKTNGATKLALLKDYERVMSLGLIEEAEKIRRKQAEAAAAEKAASEEAANAPKDEITLKIEALIAKRLDAKKARDYASADAIRAELSEMGVDIIDTPQGTKYTIR